MAPPPDDSPFTTPEYRLLSFLRLKNAGEPLPATAAAHFHDADIYTADPALLTMPFDPAAPAKKGESGSWFFFTHVRPKSSSDSRKSRQVAGGVGTWHSERAPRRVLDDEGNCVGHSQYFSYKLKIGKNCSERTEWYMVEFSDAQEADHERVRGGEPELVLCKIYKAHTHSRSGNGSASRPSCSASARKRKAVDEASAPPVKAKRRLFDSPAPASVARSQEQVGSTTQSNLLINHPSSPATSKGKIGDTLDCIPLADGEATTSQLKIGDTSDFYRFWPETETTFDLGYTMTGGALSTLENCSRTNVRDVSDVFCRRDAWPSAFHASIDTTAFVCGMPSAPILPTLENCSRDVGDVFCERDAWPFHTSNDTMTFVPVLPTLENCSMTNVRDVGDAFCGWDAWPSAYHTSSDTMAFECSMPSTSVLPLPGRRLGGAVATTFGAIM